MNTPEQNRKRESFDTHISLLNHYINFDSYKANELMDVVVELSRLMISIEHAEKQYQKNGKFEWMGTPEFHSTRTVIDSFKMEIIKKITEI